MTQTGDYSQLIVMFSAAALLPAVLAVTTTFARIVITLMFLRAGLGSPDIPPTIVVMGLALFLTVFTMRVPMADAYMNAIDPVVRGDMTLVDGGKVFLEQLQGYMSQHTRAADVELFARFAPAAKGGDCSLITLTPAFIISELRVAFLTGFIIYLPFVIVDLVVGSTLAAVGLINLPASAISLPFKVLLFVMVDGWALLCGAMLESMR